MAYNPIPEILWVGPLLAPLILRTGIGIVLLVILFKTTQSQQPTYSTGQQKKLFATGMYGLLSFCFLTGFLTQYASVFGIAWALFMLVLGNRYPYLHKESRLVYVCMLTIFVTLLLTGAGPLSFDSPL